MRSYVWASVGLPWVTPFSDRLAFVLLYKAPHVQCVAWHGVLLWVIQSLIFAVIMSCTLRSLTQRLHKVSNSVKMHN